MGENIFHNSKTWPNKKAAETEVAMMALRHFTGESSSTIANPKVHLFNFCQKKKPKASKSTSSPLVIPNSQTKTPQKKTKKPRKKKNAEKESFPQTSATPQTVAAPETSIPTPVPQLVTSSETLIPVPIPQPVAVVLPRSSSPLPITVKEKESQDPLLPTPPTTTPPGPSPPRRNAFVCGCGALFFDVLTDDARALHNRGSRHRRFLYKQQGQQSEAPRFFESKDEVDGAIFTMEEEGGEEEGHGEGEIGRAHV